MWVVIHPKGLRGIEGHFCKREGIVYVAHWAKGMGTKKGSRLWLPLLWLGVRLSCDCNCIGWGVARCRKSEVVSGLADYHLTHVLDTDG